MRSRGPLALVFSGLVLATGGAACGSFGSTSASGGDGGTANGSGDAAVTPGVACPPPAAPSCAPEACSQRTLYLPDAPSYPFAVATDGDSVFWLEQRNGAAGDDAYNGHASARVLRTSRAGSAEVGAAEVLGVGQREATALAVVPPYVYWATFDGTRSTLSRVTTTCAAPCTPEAVRDYPAHIGALAAAGTTALFALGVDGGKVVRFAIDPSGAVANGAPVLTTDNLPGMVLTGTHVYGTSLLVAHVSRATLDGVEVAGKWAPLSFATGDRDIGLGHVATDCTDLFGVHGPEGTLERVSLSTQEVTTMTSVGSGVYDMAADAKYLYIAALNGGGVSAVATSSGLVKKVWSGSAFSIAVDAAGVYWGDHPNEGGGKLTMLVK